ncbi:MAG: hypothetical protein OXF46_10750 [Rhodobacteraceae bacterium]|nr:hypothetical protein [Paracoccaceae bacterium]
MTAEIALLNRNAIALAADSVVTLTGNSVSKTFDSAEKIFELSRNYPIGLMIYNNPEVLNIPIEILIREFREKFNDDVLKIEDVWPQVKNYIIDESQNYPNFHNHQSTHLKYLISPFFEQVEKVAESNLEFKPIIELLTQYLRYLKSIQIKKFDIQLFKKFKNAHEQEIHKIIENNFPNINKHISDNPRRLVYFLMHAYYIIKSKTSSPFMTGLVFAGFGKEERFPALSYVEIDGFYFGEPRVIKSENIVIDREGHTSAILPFAQKLMPERFVFGIDYEFTQKIQTFFSNSVETILNNLSGEILDKKSSIKQMAIEQFQKELGDLKIRSFEENNSIVHHLSKKELADYASLLVDLSSLHLRFSGKVETVGGPIDVAILTKNEGFIWVNRKKYFDLELNPSYHERRNVKQKVG